MSESRTVFSLIWPWLRGLLILAFGALPSLVPGFFAFWIMLLGFSVTGENLFGGLSTAVWGLFGVVGALTLCIVPFVRTTPTLAAGIVAGLLAMSPLSIALLFYSVRERGWLDFHDDPMLLQFSALSTTAVGIWILVEYGWRWFFERKSG